ncbi:MAG TPA: flavodoxin-dependent (E)-4-hydroxy-3-methylbut-2-enyl-diphosphate synthase [Planctomycetota bacterium]|nr:4-hydroxy-3-methylbut-2-en-1-yl diphosphate synthase [Planctomycetota bacterium]MDP6128948.1 flavodoxin-dependent (E)-4-hydroxy-3-methylbut-2-enyl-diphosphate synthase [Planctomycetota bacterium]MDP7245135.1 flavodoxin-dependent (E)-4-hydroxy-3-methylbut-2-enyl-diphosphate synthase [Planctomycetota bacterium]HJM40529.1 flavodoxin-dependent (E)-4-hydroxy-3-methylbut-2-enyl-diphosphate synthase [Planctomycetota bacterium]
MARRATRTVRVGDLEIGSGHPIWVQSMTSSSTADIPATCSQIESLVEAGCELVRVTVDTDSAADALPEIRANCPVPLIADIHFTHRLALRSIDAGVDKVRLNPGNIGSLDRVREVVQAAASARIALRIGVNSGSVEKDLLEKHGYPSADAMVESALRHCETVEEMGFSNFVVSLKSTDTKTVLEANRLFAAKTDIPLHLGVTEAGRQGYGSLKSAVGLGALLLDGIGDTVRVSLTGEPAQEIPVAFDILKATGARVTSPELIACPTCGRIDIDLDALLSELEERLEGEKVPIKIAVLGCVVNGPGEAQEADIGIAGGGGKGILYRNGEQVRVVPEDQMVDALLEEIALFKERQPQD